MRRYHVMPYRMPFITPKPHLALQIANHTSDIKDFGTPVFLLLAATPLPQRRHLHYYYYYYYYYVYSVRITGNICVKRQ